MSFFFDQGNAEAKRENMEAVVGLQPYGIYW